MFPLLCVHIAYLCIAIKMEILLKGGTHSYRRRKHLLEIIDLLFIVYFFSCNNHLQSLMEAVKYNVVKQINFMNKLSKK